MSAQFRHFDTKQKDGVFVVFERVISEDESACFIARTEKEVLENLRAHHDEGMTIERALEYLRGEWYYVGVQAKARIHIIRNGHGTYYTLLSPGLWGIESDSGEEYLNEVFEEEKNTLRADLEAMKNFEERKG